MLKNSPLRRATWTLTVFVAIFALLLVVHVPGAKQPSQAWNIGISLTGASAAATAALVLSFPRLGRVGILASIAAILVLLVGGGIVTALGF